MVEVQLTRTKDTRWVAESDVASVDKTRLEQASPTEFPESVDIGVYNAKTLNSLVTRMIVWNEVWSGLRHDPFLGFGWCKT